MSSHLTMIYQLTFFMTLLLLFMDSKSFVDCTPADIGGKYCCFEEWNKHVGKVIHTFKMSKNFTSKEFFIEFDRWNISHKNYLNDEPKGICKGYLSYTCNVKSKRCECTNDDTLPFKYKKGTGGGDFDDDQSCFGDDGAFCLKNGADCKPGFICVQNKTVANGRFYHCMVDPNPTSAPGQNDKSGCDSNNVPYFNNIGLFQFTIIFLLNIFIFQQFITHTKSDFRIY